jgi:ankyrin repeat protein
MAIVESLIKHGASINAQTIERITEEAMGSSATLEYNDKTPLHIAAEHGHLNVVKFLIEKGSNLKIRDSQRRYADTSAIENGNYRSLQDLC